MAFTGFLSSQILWDTFESNAKLVDQDKDKFPLYENNFQTLDLITTKSTRIKFKEEKTPIILLNFWASWCLPCLKEFPSLVAFQEKYHNQVKVVGINGDTDDAKELILKTEKKYKLNFESVDDSSETISSKFLVSTYPVSIVFHKGKVIYVSKKIHDFMDTDFLEKIDNALKVK